MKKTSTIFWALTLMLAFSTLIFAQDRATIRNIIERYDKGETLDKYELDLISDHIKNVEYNFNHFTEPRFPSGEKAAILDEGFESGIPADWTVVDNDGDGKEWVQSTDANHTGTYGASISYNASGNDDWLITKQLTVRSGDIFSFWAKSRSSTYLEDFNIKVSKGTTALADFTITLESITDHAASWVEHTYDLTGGGFGISAGDNIYIAIQSVSVDEFNLYVDDFLVDASSAPGCTTPVSPTDAVNDVDINGTLEWNAASGATDYTLYFGSDGGGTSDPTNIVNGVDQGNTTTYSYTGLSYSTTYYWKVVPKNSVGSASGCSIWSFTTMADPTLTPPFTEDFSSYLPTNWTEGQGTLAAPSTITETFSSWTQDDYRNDTGDSNGESAKINIYGATCDEWLFTPPVDLGSGATHYQLEFDLALTDYGSTGDPDQNGTDDKFAVIISTDNGVTWSSANTLKLWDNSTSPTYSEIPAAGEHITIDLTSYSGTVKFGFYGESTSSNADNDLFVDNVQVREIPTTPTFSVDPSSKDFGTVNLTSSSAAQTFTISNTGAGTLTISSAPSITGTNTGDFSITDGNTYPKDLAANESITLDVTFSPQAAGARSANLHIVANAKADHDVPLTGTGHDATISTFPHTENFDAAASLPTDWEQDPANTEDWLFGSSASYAASSDHTTGSGNIAWIDDSTPHTTDPINLITPPFDISGLTTPTVSFYYWIGRGNGRTSTLHIDVYNGSTWTNDVTTALTENGAWQKVTIDVTAYKSTGTKVRFRGIEDATNYDSDISIDDFRIGEPQQQSLNSVTVTQASTSNAILGSSNNEILTLDFDVEGGVGTLPLNSIAVTGSNTSDSDVASNGVKLYRTSTATFATDNLVGTGTLAKGSVTFSGINYNLPAGHTYFWVTYDVATNGTVGNSLDAKIAAGGINVNGSTYNATEDDPAGYRTVSGLTFTASNILQASTSDINIGSSDNEILQIELTVEESTTSGSATVDFTSLNVTTVNTSDADVSSVKLYRTANTTFSTDNLVGTSAISKNTKGTATFSMTENLAEGTTYYWVAYDISSNATDGNTVDAKIPVSGMTIGGSTYNGTEDDPAGSRTLRQYNSGGNGTDYGGYYWSNSTSGSQNGNPPTYSWIDPVSNGHTLIDNATDWDDDQPGGDDSYFTATIPFGFNFFGTSYTTVYINSNGALSFGTASRSSAGSSLSIPSETDPDNLIAGCMMDLDNNPTGYTTEGAVYYGTTGGEFVVTWVNYYDYSDASEWITFQIILKPSGNIKIQYNLSASNLDAAVSSTTINGDALIGIENADGTVGLQYRNNGVGGPIFDPAKASNMAIEFGQSANSLPVELTSFTAELSERNVALNWRTETEVDAYSFQVERTLVKENGTSEFEIIGEVKAAGNSNSPKEYSFVDEKVNSGTYQYRLKMVDTDGSFEYSDVVEVEVELPMKYSLSQNYPNPFNPSTKIEYSIPENAQVKIILYNIMGEVVGELVNKNQDAGFYTINVDMAQFQNGLASGIYLYRMIAESKTTGKAFVNVKKMILLK